MTTRPKMPADSVRGRIRAYIEQHAAKLGDDVLEVGSRLHNPKAWYLINRDLAKGNWTGMDFQPGEGVDVVGSIECPPHESASFTGILCSEVLEHVQHPWIAMAEMFRLLKPGGHVVITTLTTFHIHGYPDDYWRFTTSGLSLLMKEAGFTVLDCHNEGEAVLKLKNHDEQVFVKKAPLQIFAVGQKPV